MAKIKQIDGLQTALDAKVEKNANITGATKCKITYDAKGLVTAGADLAAADIPTLDIVSKTSGTLTVSRGGTGKTSVTANSYLKGAGTGALIERTYAEVKTDLGLQNASNYAAIKKAASSTVGRLPKWSVTTGDEIVDGYDVVTAISSSGAEDTKIPTEAAVANAISTALAAADAMTYKGVIDCSTNPNYPAANAGDTYKVSVAGKIGGASGVSVQVGYILICTVDNTVTGDHATVGANWDVIPINNAGEVIGPSSAGNLRIAVFDGTTGKLIKDGGKTIAEIEASVALTQEKRTITGKESSASTLLIMTAVLGHSVKANTIPQLTINGLAYELGTYGSLTDGQWAHSGTNVQVKMPFAIETTDEFIITYNY